MRFALPGRSRNRRARPGSETATQEWPQTPRCETRIASAPTPPFTPRTVRDVFERLQVPESNGPIRGPGCQQKLVRVVLEDGHGAVVGRKLPEELSGLEVPDLPFGRRFRGFAVVRGSGGGASAAVGGAGWRLKIGCCDEGREEAARAERPWGYRHRTGAPASRASFRSGKTDARLDAAVLPARCNPPPVGAEGDFRHPARVALVRVNAPFAADVPDLHVRVKGPGGEELACGWRIGECDASSVKDYQIKGRPGNKLLHGMFPCRDMKLQARPQKRTVRVKVNGYTVGPVTGERPDSCVRGRETMLSGSAHSGRCENRRRGAGSYATT